MTVAAALGRASTRPGAVLVTGVASGIGRAIALRLVTAGWPVAGVDQNPHGAEWGRAVAERDPTVRWSFVPADVAEESAVERAVKTLRAELGSFAALVHCAGICHLAPLMNMSVTLFDRTVAVQLRGAFLCARAVVGDMQQRAWGRLVNIGSVAGLHGGGPGLAHYAAAKAAIVGFTKALALELGRYGITANVVAPGLVDTPMVRGSGLPESALSEYAKRVPIGRVGRPEDVAAAVEYLVSDEAGFVTGQVLSPNGGAYQ